MRTEEELSPAEPLRISFDSFSPERGLTVAISAIGDKDGETTFANHSCCGIDNAQQFIRDVHIEQRGKELSVSHRASGWTVRHEPLAMLTITYRLPATGPMVIDTGTAEQLRPIVHDGVFHLVGTTALLLPIGHSDSDRIALDVDATKVVQGGNFVSSFGPGANLRDFPVKRSQVAGALYLGGPITLTINDTPTGKVGVVFSAMDSTVNVQELKEDALAIIATERKFFVDGQPWYLVSVHGGRHQNPEIQLGGGMGLTNSFVMFVASDLDLADAERREQFRLVLAHEYFHEWNGLTLRVASLPYSNKDDASNYWFSEGVTEFYTLRLLNRAGLQPPDRSLVLMNDKLRRYGRNSKRSVSAREAGKLFWTDADGEQIPYLRGYLAAWAIDIAMRRSFAGKRDLDTAMQALVKRAKAEPEFRVDSSFLATYLTEGMPARDADRLRKFLIDGGDAPLDESSFSPCLVGKKETLSGRMILQFDFSSDAPASCFRH